MTRLFSEKVAYLESESDFSDYHQKFKNQKELSNDLLRKCALKFDIKLDEIERDDFGAPILASELIGTTSHSKNKIIAAVAKKEDFLGIGLDIQEIKTVNKNLGKKILTDEELKIYQNDLKILKIFSIKESIYKAYYLATQEKLTWKSVNIKIIDDNYFTEIHDIVLTGEIRISDNFIITSCEYST